MPRHAHHCQPPPTTTATVGATVARLRGASSHPVLGGLLPGASALLHPLATLLCWGYAYATFRIVVGGLHHYRREPGTAVLFNHRRDSDVPLLTAILCSGRGLWSTGRRLHYMARDDLFRPGFLAAYLPGPPWVRRLLLPLSVGGLLRLLRAHPIARVRERTLADVLHDLRATGEPWRVDRVLRPGALEELGLSGRVPPDAPLEVALRRGGLELAGVRWSPRWLQPAAYEAWGRHLARCIAAQLSAFARLLDAGSDLLMAPEGVLSPDGSLGRVRSGLREVLRRCRAPVRLLPVGLTYDWMVPGRTRVFVEVGPAVDAPGAVPEAALGATVRCALARLQTVTASNLFSAWAAQAAERDEPLPAARRLGEELLARARELAAQGVRVDPVLLSRPGVAARLRGLLRYAVRRGIVRPGPRGWEAPLHLGAGPGAGWQEVRYGANELREVLEAARAAQAHPGPAVPSP